MNRFWRRCGTYAYKYDLEASCCQPYPIRLDVTEFQISKSQKKVLKKFYNYLLNGKKTENTDDKEMIEEKPEVKDEKMDEINQLKVDQMNKMLEFVKLVQSAYLDKENDAPDLVKQFFEINDKGDVEKMLNGVFISDCKDKKLNKTMSWSSNIVLKIHFLLKSKQLPSAMNSQKDLSAAFSKIDEFKSLSMPLKFEASGYVTFVSEVPRP